MFIKCAVSIALVTMSYQLLTSTSNRIWLKVSELSQCLPSLKNPLCHGGGWWVISPIQTRCFLDWT